MNEEKQYTLVAYRHDNDHHYHEFEAFQYISEDGLICNCANMESTEHTSYTFVVSTVANGKLVSTTDFLGSNVSMDDPDLERVRNIILDKVEKIVDDRVSTRKQKEDYAKEQAAARQRFRDIAELERLKKLYPQNET